MDAQLERAEATLPPGKYIIGDPCYNIPDHLWHDVLDASDSWHTCHATFPLADGGEGLVVAFHTKNGDGRFDDGHGREYPVDSGSIGIISVDHIPEPDLEASHVITFKNPVHCYLSGSVIVFGHIEINTEDPEAEEDDGDDGYNELGFDDEY